MKDLRKQRDAVKDNQNFKFSRIHLAVIVLSFAIMGAFSFNLIRAWSNDGGGTNVSPGNATPSETNSPTPSETNSPTPTATVPVVPADASIGDTVWNDVDGDGSQNNGEAGIENVVVSLIRDINGNGQIDNAGTEDNVVSTKTTNASGNYLFEDLYPGDYIVDVTDANNALTGMTITTDNDPLAVALAESQNYLDADFGYKAVQAATSCIGNFVWEDTNGDGVQDAGENGLSNVTLALYEGAVTGTPAATTTTDSNGAYQFCDLEDGTYNVDVTDDNGVVSDHTLTGGSDPVEATLSGDDNNDVDFGYQPPAATPTPTPTPQTACIGDLVWLDANENNVQDSGESGVGGVTIRLLNAEGANLTEGSITLNDLIGLPLVTTVTTSSDGTYSFCELDNGTYVVSVTDNSNVLEDYVPAGNTLVHRVVQLSGSDNNDIDFGYKIKPDPEDACIGNEVWHDLNGNGVRDLSEPSISGVTVQLYSDTNGNGQKDDNNASIRTQTTNALGNYNFCDLPGGSYIVSVTDEHGILENYDLTTNNEPLSVTIVPSQKYEDADFGYVFEEDPEDASIGDFVWNDQNGDGSQDAGEPGIANVVIGLYVDDNGNGLVDDSNQALTTTTDENGLYLFQDLAAGDYIVDVIDSNGELVGLNLTGGNDPHIVKSLLRSQAYRSADFGYQSAPDPNNAVIGDYVWNDQDGDGLQDASEPGIVDVTITLHRDADGNGVVDNNETLVGNTSTDANGAYLFEGLSAGNYIVTVTDDSDVLSGYTLTVGSNPHVVGQLSGGQQYLQADFGYQYVPQILEGALSIVVVCTKDDKGLAVVTQNDTKQNGTSIPSINFTIENQGVTVHGTTVGDGTSTTVPYGEAKGDYILRYGNGIEETFTYNGPPCPPETPPPPPVDDEDDPTITVTTPDPATVEVEYGPNGDLSQRLLPNTGPGTDHSLVLDEDLLRAGTEYSYRVIARDAEGNVTASTVGSFTTPAAGVSYNALGVSGVILATILITSAGYILVRRTQTQESLGDE